MFRCAAQFLCTDLFVGAAVVVGGGAALLRDYGERGEEVKVLAEMQDVHG